MRLCFSVLVLSGVLATGLTAQQGVASLESLGFMTGCWVGRSDGNSTIEETYSHPSTNVMLGTTRYLRDGRTTMFEFTLISRDSSGVNMLPYPRGRASEHAFQLTGVEHSRAVFEAPEHDFPKRIIYHAVDPDHMVARIDDGDGSQRAAEWRLARVACPAAP